MYGALRFLYNNLITSHTMLTLSSQATGRKSGVAKDGEGTATCRIGGRFAGAFDLSFLAEIDSVSGGQEVGYATIRWRNSETATGGWEETGVLTRTNPAYALSADGLGTNLTMSFLGATGHDFELGDEWQWECRATYGAQRLLDKDRMTYWQTINDTSESIIIDFGSPQTVTAAGLHDHNFTSGATVKLQANASNSWGSPSYDNTLSSITDPLIAYPVGQNYRYWKWDFADASNPDTYITAANIFMGTYLELGHVHAEWGAREQPAYTIQRNQSEVGVQRKYVYASQHTLDLGFGDTLSNTDVDSLVTMQEALINTTTKQAEPLWVHLFSDVETTLKLMHWDNIESWQRAYSSYLLNSNVNLKFEEVVKV